MWWAKYESSFPEFLDRESGRNEGESMESENILLLMIITELSNNQFDFSKFCDIVHSITKGSFLNDGPVSFLRKNPFVKVAT